MEDIKDRGTIDSRLQKWKLVKERYGGRSKKMWYWSNIGGKLRGLGFICGGEVKYLYITKPLEKYYCKYVTLTTVNYKNCHREDWDVGGNLGLLIEGFI